MDSLASYSRPATDIAALPKIPQLSIVLSCWPAPPLERALSSIFDQQDIASFEVILCDDTSSDDAWSIAKCYVRRYPQQITASRTCFPVGKELTARKAALLCRGRYALHLEIGQTFDSERLSRQLKLLAEGHASDYPGLTPTKKTNFFMPTFSQLQLPTSLGAKEIPLVSICIHNYNYGRYLRQCLESVLAQTYPRIEICFSDNASSDDSWEIANELASLHSGKIHLTRNRLNFGPGENFWNCRLHVRGKYLVKLCSDDALHPEFAARCVAALEAHPDAAFAMVHREIIDEDGRRTPEPPFYDRSCLIPGAGQAAVYLMSAVNPSISQVMYHAEKSATRTMTGNLNDRWHGDRLVDFHLCADSSLIYIKDALLLNRVHPDSDGSAIDANLLQCMTQYVLVHQFTDIANHYGTMSKAAERLPAAIDKIGRLCLRYSLRFILKQDIACAKRYFHLAQAIYPEIVSEAQFTVIDQYLKAAPQDQDEILTKISAQTDLTARTVSYTPPLGSRPL